MPSRTKLAAALFLAAYFVWFVQDGTRVGWTNDDPMNLYMYWKPRLGKVLQSNIMFWNGFYRPLGGLFYLPLYALFHMNPAPYRWVMCGLLGLNALLVYRLALRLSESPRAAWLAALLVCVHGGMADLVYNTSSIYDVLAVLFSLLALIEYVAGRRWLVLILLVLAINAKEIAATLPAFFLLYEVLFRPWKDLRKTAWFSFVALAVAGVAMYGKMHGAEAMTVNEAYRPIFTASRWWDANVSYAGTILYRPQMGPLAVFGVWIGMAAVTWFSKSRTMAWALAVIFLCTIPISFIPKRVGGSLYLPLVAWSIWMAALLDWLISFIRVHRLRLVATGLLAIGLWRLTAYEFSGKGEAWRATQGTDNAVLSALEAFPYRPPLGTRVLFVGSPYKDVYDLVFLSNLVWNDRTLDIKDANMEPDHGADRSSFPVVIAFQPGGALEVLKQ